MRGKGKEGHREGEGGGEEGRVKYEWSRGVGEEGREEGRRRGRV